MRKAKNTSKTEGKQMAREPRNTFISVRLTEKERERVNALFSPLQRSEYIRGVLGLND